MLEAKPEAEAESEAPRSGNFHGSKAVAEAVKNPPLPGTLVILVGYESLQEMLTLHTGVPALKKKNIVNNGKNI